MADSHTPRAQREGPQEQRRGPFARASDGFEACGVVCSMGGRVEREEEREAGAEEGSGRHEAAGGGERFCGMEAESAGKEERERENHTPGYLSNENASERGSL